ncbi:MAG: nucleotidyl transferase AbiEii/AbiGii toxin family protein [Ginsengibacter sp.]
MESISTALLELIIVLQKLDSLRHFSLAGGTSLALRFDHRKSVDIDLFSNLNIGFQGFQEIKKEFQKHFPDNLFYCEIENSESGDQFCFLKALIRREKENFKVEILQNFQHLDDIQIQDGIKVLSVEDIGLFKLMSASNRKAKKDIYDLDYITDQIPLSHLINKLKTKTERFNADEFKCLFDLDEEKSPVDDLNLLLAFDDINYSEIPYRPSHSNDKIEITTNAKLWKVAKASWRRKVRELMNEKGFPLPSVKPIN